MYRFHHASSARNDYWGGAIILPERDWPHCFYKVQLKINFKKRPKINQKGKKQFVYYYYFPPTIGQQWSKLRPKSDHSRLPRRAQNEVPNTCLFLRECKIKICLLNKAFLFSYLLPFSFQKWPHFKKMYKKRAFKLKIPLITLFLTLQFGHE